MKRIVVLALAAAATIAGNGATAQESTLTAERTVDFRSSRTMDLKAAVGPVLVTSVEFMDLGKDATSGRVGRLKVGNASQASTLLKARIQAENPSADEWAVTFTIEFLDKSGAVVDKITKRSTWEGEVKAYEFEHPILAYAVALIERVRISMEAKLD
jgi:hypothetical protein